MEVFPIDYKITLNAQKLTNKQILTYLVIEKVFTLVYVADNILTD